MLKTSATQFTLMVEYMERHGDLSKPSEGANGRITSIRHWSDLTELLNSDASGASKSLEKWRKVWSDLKNNSKRKAARINRAANGTGGGPATKITLSDLEQRVLNILNPLAATGLPEVQELGLHDMQDTAGSPPVDRCGMEESLLEVQYNYPEDLNQPGTSSDTLLRGGQSTETTEVDPLLDVPAQPVTPSAAPPTPERRQEHRINALSPRRRKRSRPATQAEATRQAFLQSDREWREYQMRIEDERLRLRAIELQQQARWQDLFAQFLSILDRVITNIDAARH